MSNEKKTLSISPYSDPESLKASVSGVNTTNGSFRSTAPELQFTGDRSIVVLFTTPDHSIDEDNSYIFTDATYRDGRSLYIRGLSLFVGYGLNTVCLEKTVSTSTLYFVVISEHDQIVSAYLNGLDPIVIPPDTYTAPTGLKIGRGSTVSTRYQGVIHSCLLFNYALTPEEVSVLWNDGEPLLDENINLASVGWYGIEWDITDPDPVCKRIGNMSLHRMLPIQSKMRGCLLNDDGEVVKYLNPDDWTNEVRDGSQGQVMVEIPQHYVQFESDGNIRRCKMSEQSLPGYTFIPTKYVSAYEATVQRSTSKLSSVVNTTEDYRGGDNNSAWDGTYRSFLGLPATDISRTKSRTYARNRKEGSTEWNCLDYNVYKSVFWLYYVEYANRNCQSEFNAEKDANGFAQGGLGVGATNIDNEKWNAYNNNRSFIPCGYTDELGNGTGEVEFTMPQEYDTETFVVKVPRYRGIENPFGHSWKWTDGINTQLASDDDGGTSKVWVSSDPSKYNDSNYDGYEIRGEEARTGGFTKTLVFGENGDIITAAIGGSSTTYWADYHYTNIPASGVKLRGVMFGGAANSGSAAGITSVRSYDAPSVAYSIFGSRLCFIPGDNKEKKYYGCVAEYLPYNIINKVWVEKSNSKLNLTGIGEFDFIYKVGDVDGYVRLSFPWGEEGGDNLYLFMKPPGYSQTCIIGSDENTLTKTRTKTLTFKTNHIGLVEGAQSSAELEVIQEEAVYTYTFELRSSVTGKLPAGGGSTTLSTWLTTFRNGQQVSSEPVNGTLSIPTTAGFNLSGKVLTAANRTTIVGPDRSVEVTAKYITPTGEQVTDVISVTQAANEATYENPVVQLSYPVASAAGETVLPGNATWTQKVNYTSGSTQSLRSPGTGTYSGSGVNASTGAVVVSSKGTTISGVTTVTTATLTVTANGKTGTKQAIVTQAANAITSYGNISLSGGSASDIPAAGGTVKGTGVTALQTITYTSGATRAGSISGITYTDVTASSLGTTIKVRTQVGTSKATATGEGGKTGTKDIPVYQAANNATYGDLVGGSATAADIPASGGTANVVTTNPTQTITYTSGATKAGSVTNSKDTAVSGSNLGTTAKARTKLGVIKVTFTGEGSKSKVISVDIYQAANVETLTKVYFNGVASSGTKDTIPYSGGTVTWSVAGVYSYTSGATQNKAISASAGTWSVSGSGATQNSNITTWAQNLTEGSRSATITFRHTATGISGTETTTQLSQDLVVAQYTNVVSTYSNSKAGYKK